MIDVMSKLTADELQLVSKILAPSKGRLATNFLGATKLNLSADDWLLDSRRGREKIAIALNLRIANLIDGTCDGGIERVFDFFGDKGINKARIYAVIEVIATQSRAMAA